MKMTDEEFKRTCEEAYELLMTIQSAEQCIYQSPMDNSISETMNFLLDKFD